MFSDNLKKLLKEKGLSQSELANLLNTSRQNVYQWINGKTTPRPDMLQKIAKILDVNIGYLLEEKSFQEKNSKGNTNKPKTAIIEKEFFVVPSMCIINGGENGGKGVLRETYNENGEPNTEFIPVTIYSEKTEAQIQGIELTEDNPNYESLSKKYVYLDDTILKSGDNLLVEESSEKFTIGRIGSLNGVYNINKGYADFKVVNEINSNEEYSIVRSDTQYGLLPYDYIVLDASSVEADDLVYE